MTPRKFLVQFLDNGATCNTSLVKKMTFSPSNKHNTKLQNHNASEAAAFLIRWTNLIKKAVAFETSRVYSVLFCLSNNRKRAFYLLVIYLNWLLCMMFHRNSVIYTFQIKLAASLHARSVWVALSLYALSLFFCQAFHLRTVRLSLLFVAMKIINIFRVSREGSLVTNTQTTRIKDSQVNQCD